MVMRVGRSLSKRMGGGRGLVVAGVAGTASAPRQRDPGSKPNAGASKPKIGGLRAFRVLLVRSVRETGRNRFVNGVRMGATLVLAGLFGLVWGENQSVVDIYIH